MSLFCLNIKRKALVLFQRNWHSMTYQGVSKFECGIWYMSLLMYGLVCCRESTEYTILLMILCSGHWTSGLLCSSL